MSLFLDQVSYTYPGTTHGLKEVSLSIETGELVAVIGPSGSGKSTLLKLISGLETDHSGAILLDGENLCGKPVHKRNIGMVFQQYALFPHLDVIHNVAYGLKLRKVPENERLRLAREMLETVGLTEYATGASASFPAASSSAWRWRGRWPSTPRPCCLMNRWLHSTPAFAAICVTRSAPFNDASTPPPCSSPMIRKRR